MAQRKTPPLLLTTLLCCLLPLPATPSPDPAVNQGRAVGSEGKTEKPHARVVEGETVVSRRGGGGGGGHGGGGGGHAGAASHGGGGGGDDASSGHGNAAVIPLYGAAGIGQQHVNKYPHHHGTSGVHLNCAASTYSLAVIFLFHAVSMYFT